GGLATGFFEATVLGEEGGAVHLLAPEVFAVTGVGDADLAEHLADDDLDVLVVDGHALETIHLLHLADEELIQRGRAEDLEDLVRVGRAFGEMLALVDHVAGLHDDVLAGGDEVLLLLRGLFVADDELALAAQGALERDDALDAGHLGGVLRTTGFEELGDAGETTGDVLGLGGLTGGLGEQGAGLDDVAFVDDDLGADGNRVGGQGLAGGVAHLDLRVEVFLVLDDHGRDAAGGFVELVFHGDAADHVLDREGAALFGEHGHVVGIPLGEHTALFDRIAVADMEEGADHDVVGLDLAILGINDDDRTGLVEHDVGTFGGLHEAEAAILDLAGGAHADLGGLETAGGDAADVERAHGELGARLADGLRGDDADGVAGLGHAVGRGVDAVALAVDAGGAGG